MAGPAILDRPPRSPGVPTTEPDRLGGQEEGCLAYDQWADHINLLKALAVKLPALAGRLRAIAGKHQRRLVWLRNAGIDPTIERRKQALRDAREQAVRDARGRRQAAKEARVAAHLARRERSRAAREAAADQEEEARRSSAAVNRPQRDSAVPTTAAIHAARLCNQSTPFEPPPAAVGAQDRAEPARFRCTRGHFLVPAPVRSGRDSFQTRCNGPCGLRIRPGTTRWMCEGRGCDLDICLECVGKDDSEGSARARTRCPLGHSMCFRLTSALAHPDRKCDGECRRPLVEGTWAYECAQCALDLCAACAPEGITPTAAPPAALAPRKRGREPPSRPARVRQAARGTGAVRRARHGSKRRNLFDDESDGGSGSEADPQHAAQAEVCARRTKRSREPDATCSRPAGGPHRQAYGEGPGRKRSSPPSIHSRGQGL